MPSCAPKELCFVEARICDSQQLRKSNDSTCLIAITKMRSVGDRARFNVFIRDGSDVIDLLRNLKYVTPFGALASLPTNALAGPSPDKIQ
jgi:hypothetical protein